MAHSQSVRQQEPNLGWRSLPTHDLRPASWVPGTRAMVYARQSTIPAGCGWLSIWARTGSFTMSRTPPKRAHVCRHRDTRGDHQAGDGIDGAAIGIGDRSQRHNRIDHIEELWRGHAGQEMDHFGRNDQEQVRQGQNREDLIRMRCLAPRAAAVAQAACPLRDKSANRRPGRSRIEWLADRSRCWSR